MVFFSQPLRAPRLFWLLANGAPAMQDSLRTASGNAGIAIPNAVSSPSIISGLPCLRLDIDQQIAWSDALSGAERDTQRLLTGGLPSQIAQGNTGEIAPVTIMLDIIMGDTTDEAWEKTERLIAQGLPARIAASALIGTAQDIAGRIESYRALGVARIVLTAPPERAPYEAVARHLLPLLGQTAGERPTEIASKLPHIPGLTALAQAPT